MSDFTGKRRAKMKIIRNNTCTLCPWWNASSA